MPTTRLYDYSAIVSAIYYDVINMMGEEGIYAKLTAYDLLAVMAAPCTRLDYDKAERSKLKPLMVEVHRFVTNNKRISNLAYNGLVRELNASFIPMLAKEKQENLIEDFKIVMGFDADGYAIFNKKYYDVYKKNMDTGTYTKITYSALSSQSTSDGLPDREITKTYCTKKIGNVQCVDLDFTVQDWVDILRGVSEKAMTLIGAFCEMEDCRATHYQIEEKFGIMSESINGITAKLGERVKRIMGVEVVGLNGEATCWTLPFNNGRYETGGNFSWQLRPEVAEAYKKLKK